MKVAIDITPLKTAHRFRGIGAYTKRLVEALQSIEVADFEIVLVKKGEVSPDCDLIHYPYFDLFFRTLPLKRGKKTVVTIHDTTPLVFPKHYPPGVKGKLRLQAQKLALKTVNGVITDSKNSKKDIVKYLKYPKDKIHVVYLAPGEEFRQLKIENLKLKIKQKYRLPNAFVLYVGDVNYNKNIPGLIKAFARIEQRTKNKEQRIGLVLVGKAFLDKDLKETRQILQLIKELSLNNQIKILGFIPDKDLVAIYNLATVYCQPSFYEGFGLPVLEAMACGTPVVTSKKASLPEIAGKAAVFIDPYDIKDIANGLTVAIEDEDLREELIARGLKQAKKFSWEKTANETYKVYQKILAKK